MIEHELNTPAFVGVKFENTVIYNILDNETEFLHTGLSIINYLKHDKNKFFSDIITSQRYNGIKYIFDDKMVFNELFDVSNCNTEYYNIISETIKSEFDNVYIYDYNNDLLILLDNDEYIAIDYKNEQDVRKFINKLKF